MCFYFRLFVACLVTTLWYAGTVAAEDIQGWVVWGNEGQLFVSDGSGRQELTGVDNVRNACWSAEGKYIYAIADDPDARNRGGGEDKYGAGTLWRMYNDGSNPVHIPGEYWWHGRVSIASYRPDDAAVFYVEDNTFYYVDSSGNKETVYSDSERDYVGEFAISADGGRIAARSAQANLYKIDVTGDAQLYDYQCQASITPDGSLLSANQSGHQGLDVYSWNDRGEHPSQTVAEPTGNGINSGRFAVNSNEHFVYTYDNDGGIAVLDITTGEAIEFVQNWSGFYSPAHPDFWLGDLPPVDPVSVRDIQRRTDAAQRPHKVDVAVSRVERGMHIDIDVAASCAYTVTIVRCDGSCCFTSSHTGPIRFSVPLDVSAGMYFVRVSGPSVSHVAPLAVPAP
jgi:hypothetical protein